MGQAKKYHLIGRNSLELTLADLPAKDTRRWYANRKMLVVRAVQIGLLSFDQASERYGLSLEEFIGWQKLAANSSKRSVNSAVLKALRTGPLWIGSDHDSSQAPLGTNNSKSF